MDKVQQIQWEYLEVPFINEESFNEYGKEGWELILIDDRGRGWFKRPLLKGLEKDG